MPVPFSPAERSPLLQVFGGLAPLVAVLIRTRPALAGRLVFAPPEAVHALAAFLHHGVPDTLSDAELAELVDTKHPRELLLKTFPDVPRSFYRALRASGGPACESAIYLRAACLAVSPLAEPFLGGDPLAASRLSHFETLLNADPLIQGMHHALPVDPSIVDAVSNVFRLLRAHNALPEDIDIATSAGPRAALRCVLRLIDGLKAPALPFALPSPYMQIGTVGELRRTGRAYKNCVRDRWHGPRFWLDAASGADAFILCNQPGFLARLNRVGGDHYTICEIAGPANASIAETVRRSFVDALRQAGAKIFNDDPARSLSRLLDRLGHVRSGAGAELDFGDDYLAA